MDWRLGLWHLIIGSIHLVVSWMGTTILAVSVLAAPFVLRLGIAAKKSGWQGVKDAWRSASKYTLAVWATLFAIGVMQFVYEDHQRLVAANTSLRHQLENVKQPKLVGTIQEIITGNSPELRGAQAFVLMTVINNDEPTAVEGFHLDVDGPSYHANVLPRKFPKTLRLHLPSGRVAEFHDSDALYEKTISPVQRGVPKRGWLRYVFEGITADNLRSAKWTVHFQDYIGTQYQAISTLSCDTNCEPMYFPGASQPFTPRDFDRNGNMK